MPKKVTAPVQHRRRSAPETGRVRLREQFRSYARSVILEAGEDVLASQGVFAARMEEVAQRAQVAVGTIYNLIGDRDALVGEILRLRTEQVVALLHATQERVSGQPFREQAQVCMTALLAYCREHRRFLRMVLESERGPACTHKRLSQDMITKIRDVYRDLVARGIAEGVLRRDVRELAPAMLMGMMREVILMDIELEPKGSASDRVSALLSIFVEGAGVR